MTHIQSYKYGVSIIMVEGMPMSSDQISTVQKEAGSWVAQLRELFTNRGWEIREISKEEANLVPVAEDGAVGCMDGRRVKKDQPEERINRYEKGPKTPGGVIGVAIGIVKDGSENGIQKACELIKNSGFAPGSHDIPENHCGAKKLADADKYANLTLPKLEADAESIQAAVEAMGIAVHLEGEHEEHGMIINTDPTHTRVPDGAYFQADIGYLMSLGMSLEDAAAFFAETVEQLKPDAKIAYLVEE